MSTTIPKIEKNPIVSRYWHEVLSLLGMALVSNGAPSQKKFDAFLDAAMELKFVIDPTVKIRRQTLRSWYELHAQELSEIDFSEYDDFLESLLKDISIYGHKVDILTSLVQIVISDGDYSDNARTLTKKTILLWSIPAKHIDDIIYVCGDLMKHSAHDAEPEAVF